MGRHPITHDKRQKIIDELKNNPNGKQVAKKLGNVSRPTVCKIAKEAGIELTHRQPVPRVPITNDARRRIIRELRNNPNSSQVSKALGNVSCLAVWRIAKDVGIALGRPGRPQTPETVRTAIIEALKINPNGKQVAKKLGNVSRCGAENQSQRHAGREETWQRQSLDGV